MKIIDDSAILSSYYHGCDSSGWPSNLTKEELFEIENYMIEQWKIFKEKHNPFLENE